MTEFTTPPGPDEIVALAERALAAIPDALRRHVRNVAIAVEDFADDETLDRMGIESEWDLSGLYRGVPLGQQSVMDPARGPEMIFLYRQPILLEWIETGEDLGRLVRNVLIHEIAHHFGFSDEEITALERRGDA
ncbi:MAG TPA: metallopeptidase family protein [Acetobacteraceae bacterium]|jgi:acetylglutamate kinase|nr:metallopeptidase family protein [Acetobacteraceae bacterium]